MNIGVLTYYNVANFGANLQAVSTYMYLKKHGHNPVFFNYMSDKIMGKWEELKATSQYASHFQFIDKYIELQTPIFSSLEEFYGLIREYCIDAIIIGSDAVLQHHSIIARLKRGRRLPIYIQNYSEEQLFPNLFWGCGFSRQIPTALMSVSSQNSEYDTFSFITKKRMQKTLEAMSFISVRDEWTKRMIQSCGVSKKIDVTPDPVFAFNYNAPELVCDKEFLLEKYNLPVRYALVSLRGQSLSEDTLKDIKSYFDAKGITCAVLTMPFGIRFSHPFEHVISQPLPPNEWFSLIKHAEAYIGSNMHPIISSLHNATPCVSIDNWGRIDFWGRKIQDDSSKVLHIMKEFGVESNHFFISQRMCQASSMEIIEALESFSIEKVRAHAEIMYERYEQMMSEIIRSFQ